MHLTIPLIFGKVKIKSYRYLRTRERERRVPVCQFGDLYFIFTRR